MSQGNSLLRYLAVAVIALVAWIPSLAQTPASTLSLPADIGIVARFTKAIDLKDCQVGDTIEVQTIDDIKSGKTMILKRGSLVGGRITLVEHASSSQPETMIGIVFDSVKPKNGAPLSTSLLIRALAPEPDDSGNSTISEGRGLPGATDNATAAGRVNAGASGSHLSAKSLGVTGIPNLRIGSRKDPKGGPVTILAVSSPGVKLKKGTEVLLKEPAPAS